MECSRPNDLCSGEKLPSGSIICQLDDGEYHGDYLGLVIVQCPAINTQDTREC